MIVKITFLDLDNKKVTMLFGNSYKKWFVQFEEFLYRKIKWWNHKEILSCSMYRIVDVQKTKENWVGYGGLKWCSEDTFQDSLNHEAEGLGWKKARIYKDINFSYDPNKFYKTKGMLKDRLRHLASLSVERIKKELNNSRNARGNE